MVQTIGILGLGRFGLALARRALSAGYEVLTATTREPAAVATLLCQAGLAAKAASFSAVSSQSDLVVLAIPLARYRSLQPQDFHGKIIVDPMNCWAVSGGPTVDLRPFMTSSEAVQAHFLSSKVVRALNHISHRDLAELPRPRNDPGRRALALAGNDVAARRVVADVIDALGYDSVEVGPLAEGRYFDFGTDIFAGSFSRKELIELLLALGSVPNK